jgi:AcrR family transcriptional regulator
MSRPGVRPIARPRQVSDEAIFRAVRETVAEEGPQVSTAAIAEKVGLSQAALFKRFGTKEALLVRGLASDSPQEMLAVFAGGPVADQPFRDQLLELVTALHGMMREMMPRIHALLACGYEPENIFQHFPVPPPVMGLRALDGWLTAAKGQGHIAADVDTRSLAKALLGTMFIHSHFHQIVGDWLVDDDAEAYATQVVDLFVFGIRTEVA